MVIYTADGHELCIFEFPHPNPLQQKRGAKAAIRARVEYGIPLQWKFELRPSSTSIAVGFTQSMLALDCKCQPIIQIKCEYCV